MFKKENWSFVVEDVRNLQLGDHIYVYMKNVKTLFTHHGIVVEIPMVIEDEKISEDEMYNDCFVLQTTNDKGMTKVSLYDFSYQKSRDIRRVKYGVSVSYELFHLAGTCHTEKPLPPEEVVLRASMMYTVIQNESSRYQLLQNNCEDLALWCKCGKTSKSVSTQVAELFCAVKHLCGTQIGHLAKLCIKPALNLWSKEGLMGILDTVKNNTSSLLEGSTSDLAEDVVKLFSDTGQGAAMGVFGGCVGALELCGFAYRIYKWKTDVNYTKLDVALDTGRSLTTAGVVFGAFCGSIALGLGWWSILPLAAIGYGTNLLLKYLIKKYGPDWKTKMYREYGIKKKDEKNIETLKAKRRELRHKILKDKLHPDKYNKNDEMHPYILKKLKEKYKYKTNTLYHLYYKCMKGVNPFEVCDFDYEEFMEYKKEVEINEKKLKEYFLITKIIEELDKDIQKLKENKELKPESKKVKQMLQIEYYPN